VCTLRLALGRGAHGMIIWQILTFFILLHRIFNLSSASLTLASAACMMAKLLLQIVLVQTCV